MKKYFLRLLYLFPLSYEYRNKILRWYGVKIGNKTIIRTGINSFGSEPYLIRIGNHCEITSGVRFITHDGATWIFREKSNWNNQLNRFGRIIINDNCFIGINTIILPNVSIGPNSIVGAGSVVTKDIPANSVAAGNPSKIICDIDIYLQKCTNEAIPGISYKSRESEKKLKEYFKLI